MTISQVKYIIEQWQLNAKLIELNKEKPKRSGHFPTALSRDQCFVEVRTALVVNEFSQEDYYFPFNMTQCVSGKRVFFKSTSFISLSLTNSTGNCTIGATQDSYHAYLQSNVYRKERSTDTRAHQVASPSSQRTVTKGVRPA